MLLLAHVGIEGDEKVDELTRKRGGKTFVDSETPLFYSITKHNVSNFIQKNSLLINISQEHENNIFEFPSPTVTAYSLITAQKSFQS